MTFTSDLCRETPPLPLGLVEAKGVGADETRTRGMVCDVTMAERRGNLPGLCTFSIWLWGQKHGKLVKIKVKATFKWPESSQNRGSTCYFQARFWHSKAPAPRQAQPSAWDPKMEKVGDGVCPTCGNRYDMSHYIAEICGNGLFLSCFFPQACDWCSVFSLFERSGEAYLLLQLATIIFWASCWPWSFAARCKEFKEIQVVLELLKLHGSTRHGSRRLGTWLELLRPQCVVPQPAAGAPLAFAVAVASGCWMDLWQPFWIFLTQERWLGWFGFGFGFLCGFSLSAIWGFRPTPRSPIERRSPGGNFLGEIVVQALQTREDILRPLTASKHRSLTPWNLYLPQVTLVMVCILAESGIVLGPTLGFSKKQPHWLRAVWAR